MEEVDFPTVPSPEKPRKEKKKKDVQPPPPTSWKSTLTKVIALISVIALVGSIPWLIAFSSEKLYGKQTFFYYLWGGYAVVELFILFYWKRKTHTWNSFATQNMIWAIFTLGFYAVVDLPKYLPPHLRQIALWLWCSFTMIFNLIWFFVDETDHVEEERKEQRKEEKRKKKEELRKQKEKAESFQFSPKTSLIINVTLYLTIIVGGGWFFYNYYLEFQDRMASKAYTIPEEHIPRDEF